MHDLLAAGDEFRVDSLLLGPEATGDAIRTAVSDLLWRTDPVDLALLYFSGHAFDDEYGNGFLAPVDMSYDRPWVHGLRMQELTHLMRSAVNKDVILLVLDACKSGIAASGDRGASPSPASFEDVFDHLDDVDEETESRGRIVLASSGPDEKSRELPACQHQILGGDSHAHGAFTFHVLEGLSGRATSDGVNVTLEGLHKYVDRELKNQTVTYFGSGVQHSAGIRLVPATNYADVSARIAAAVRHLESGAPVALFLAVEELGHIQDQVVSNDQARAVRMTIDDRLDEEAQAAVYYLTFRRLELAKYCPQTYGRVQKLLSEIRFETLIADESLLGLMIGLWEASQNPDDPGQYKTWLNAMMSFEKYAKSPAQIATSDEKAKRTGS